MIPPDTALLILTIGTFGVIYELLRPRLILPGVLAAGAVLAGSFCLLTSSSQPYFLVSGLFVAMVLLVAESFCPKPCVSGVLGTLIATFAIARACPVHLALAIPLCFMAGFAITFLVRRTRLGRLNKAM